MAFIKLVCSWLQLSEGPLAQELHVEAHAMSEKLREVDEEVNWPLIGTGGDIACLMSMVSYHEVR